MGFLDVFKIIKTKADTEIKGKIKENIYQILYELSLIHTDETLEKKIEDALVQYYVCCSMNKSSSYMKGRERDEYCKNVRNVRKEMLRQNTLNILESASINEYVPDELKFRCDAAVNYNYEQYEKILVFKDTFNQNNEDDK